MLPILAATLVCQQAPTVRIQVDPRLELLAITSWLSGQYAAPTDSAYKVTVWNHFKGFRGHPAILALKKAKRFYTDFTEIGVDLGDLKTCRFKRTKRVLYWRNEILGADSFDKFEGQLADFVRVTKFTKFFAANEKSYKTGVSDLEKLFVKEQIINRLEQFFKSDAKASRPNFLVFLEPLNGWGAHAIVDRFGDAPGDTTVRYQLGIWGRSDTFLDGPLRVTETGEMRNVSWHEASHVYVKNLFERHRATIAKSERLFNKSMLTSQNIDTWEYCLNENVVRAIVAAMVRKYDGDKLYTREVDFQVKRAGFLYVGRLAEWIWSEYLNSNTYSNFEAYFPVLLSHLEDLPTWQEK